MNSIEIIIKIALIIILITVGLFYWLLPKTKFVRKIKFNESIFTYTQIIGILSGAAGLVITIIYPESIIDLHLWELLIMPFVLVQVYWLIVIRINRTKEILDEKQDFNMTKAGGITFGFSIPVMVALLILYQNQIITGLVWFPYYLFVTIFIFSFSTLLLYKNS